MRRPLLHVKLSPITLGRACLLLTGRASHQYLRRLTTFWCWMSITLSFTVSMMVISDDGYQGWNCNPTGELTSNPPTGSPLYPIVPSFRDWPFPHDRVPTFWPPLPAGHASESCILTDSSYSKTEAHLVPREEGDWFKYNSMGQYGLDRKDTEDSANLAALRADVHTWLDARGWAIVPKANRYIAHVLDPTQAPEFFCWYHNVELSLSGGRLATEYLFARFAWTVIQLVKPFVISLSPRAVVHIQTDPDRAVTWVVENMQPAQLDGLYGGGGSRSASPNKRKRKQGSSTRDSSTHDDTGLSRAAEINMLYQRITEDHNARVRQKRRRDEDEDDYRLEESERRGRPRERRSWGTENPATTEHEDSASTVSTEASLSHDSITDPSTIGQQEDTGLGLQKTEPSLDVSRATVDVDG